MINVSIYEIKSSYSVVLCGSSCFLRQQNNLHVFREIVKSKWGIIVSSQMSNFSAIQVLYMNWIWIFEFLVFNATFSNISVISWRPVLVVEEATGKLYHLRLRVECTLFRFLQSWARTHAVLVIGLYELLDAST